VIFRPARQDSTKVGSLTNLFVIHDRLQARRRALAALVPLPRERYLR